MRGAEGGVEGVARRRGCVLTRPRVLLRPPSVLLTVLLTPPMVLLTVLLTPPRVLLTVSTVLFTVSLTPPAPGRST